MSDIKAALDIDAIRAQFPILSRTVNDKPLAYLDNAASSQKPLAVSERMAEVMNGSYANVHRGLHTMANETTEAYEGARKIVAEFLGAPSPDNIVFTKGATQAINLVAYGLMGEINAGDEIVLTQMEHHSNIVPWHFLRERFGAVLKWVPVLDDGSLDEDAFDAALSDKTKIVATTHMSNVLGTINDVKRLTGKAKDVGAAVLIDGSQGAVHLEVDVVDIGCDFYCATGHKLYGPTGIGVLYGTAEWLNRLQPFEGGGEMIADVFEDRVTYNDPPHKFEAGTPPIIEAIGLGAALTWLSQFDRQAVAAHEKALYDRAADGLRSINGFKFIGEAPGKGAILSFAMEGAHAHDVAQILDKYGIAVRAGHHCAQPLMERFGVSSTARASFGIYNTLDEADRLIEGVEKARLFLS